MIGNGIFVDSLYPDPSWKAKNKVFTDNNHNFFLKLEKSYVKNEMDLSVDAYYQEGIFDLRK